MLPYNETPVIEIYDPLLEKAGVRLLVKREDLNHPLVSGNKWWKLKYNLLEAVRRGHTTLLTFGGAYSNHIFATAAAAHELGLKSIGIIRGEENYPLNNTLAFAQERGMELKYFSRDIYCRKNEVEFITELQNKFGDFYLLPEGGTNALAVKGCIEFAKSISSTLSFNCLCLPVGTGGTMAGMIAGLTADKKVIGFSALKGGSFLETAVEILLRNESFSAAKNWQIETAYHFGGYGKMTPALKSFISTQGKTHQLPLDPVYTSKMIYGIYDMIATGKIERSSVVLMVHTGGLQGLSK